MAQSISRISKLLVDRNGDEPRKVLARRRSFGVTLRLGEDVAGSRSLQLAVLTAARIATRCFPGAVRVDAPKSVLNASCMVATKRGTLGMALLAQLGAKALLGKDGNHVLLFGDVAYDGTAARVTFDGWVGVTGPENELSRLAEREHCSLAPILAAALAISEAFLRFASVDLRAGRRVVGLSLWRPDLNHADPGALGPKVAALPRETWLLGLGHLGNAYLWALATLPFVDRSTVRFNLLDFDKVEVANVETGVLFKRRNIGDLKTRVCAEWLEALDFDTRLVERHFDGKFRRRDDEPGLALSGFDNNEARHLLPTANFTRVSDSGLGGTASNFDAVSLRTWPNTRTAEDIWPVLSPAEKEAAAEALRRAAENNPGYKHLKKDRCGLIEHAGKSVAVPFVGMVAATFVVADVLRLLNDGRRIENFKVRLGALGETRDVFWSDYSRDDLAAIAYTNAA